MGELILFLSKLLPLLLYPLGMTSVLLVIAILNFWQRPYRAGMALLLALGVLLLSSNGWFADVMVSALESQNPPLVNPPKAAAIIVLGGSTYPPNYPRQWPEVNEAGDRVLYGAKLYRDGRAPKVILSGGRIEWKDSGQAEAIDMQTLMTTMGVPRTDIILEPDSLNTFENARNVKAVLEDNDLSGKMLLVTSAMHMPRSKAIFKKQGIDVIPAPTDFLVEPHRKNRSSRERLLNILPDAEALEQTTKAMKERIGYQIYRLRGWL